MYRGKVKIITDDVFNHLRSQIVMSNEDRMGLRRPQYAFTEQDVAIIKSQAGLNSFTLMLKQWIEKSQQDVGQVNNPDFNPVEFDGFRKEAGLNSFTLTPKQWIEKTNAIGIVSKAGRYGGTYGIAKCDTFKAVFTQQVVSQLIQIPLGQNVTKNLPDEFRSSLPSIEEIEAELSGMEESQ